MPHLSNLFAAALVATATVGLFGGVSGHGIISKPASRHAGPAFREKCGTAIVDADAKDRGTDQIQILQAAGKPATADCDLVSLPPILAERDERGD